MTEAENCDKISVEFFLTKDLMLLSNIESKVYLMHFELKNCRDGSPATYRTTLDIIENGDILTFCFDAFNTAFYCPHEGYNKIHSEGDACEILIGSDPERKQYYEIEISANGDLMIALMTYYGAIETGEPILGLDFVKEPFVKGQVDKRENGYTATVSFNKKDIIKGDGEIYFNAYRLETDGGEMDKHLFALNPTMRPKFHAPTYYLYLKDYV